MPVVLIPGSRAAEIIQRRIAESQDNLLKLSKLFPEISQDGQIDALSQSKVVIEKLEELLVRFETEPDKLWGISRSALDEEDLPFIVDSDR